MKLAVMLALVTALSARAAHADQCQWLDDRAIAKRAVRQIVNHPDYVEFCEPCGDAAPGEPRRANRVDLRALDRHAVELTIDGESVDLAYIYVKVSNRQFRNLAMLAGCPTMGVSSSLRIDSESPTSVVIRAADPAPRRPAAAEPVPPMPVAAPVALFAPAEAPRAKPVVVFVETPDAIRRWLSAIAVLAALGAVGAWRMARRRVPHAPRAVHLRPRE